MDDGLFKLREAASYDLAAASYGRHIEKLAGPLAVEACRVGGITAGTRVLDVGCGTGVAARRAAVLVGSSGAVIGVDISDGMLAEARRLSSAAVESGVLRYERMDAENLELAEGSFDVVLSLCAILHFPHIDTALAEIRRVLRPGGTLVIGFGAGRPTAFLPTALHAARRAVAIVRAHGRPELRGPALMLRLAFEELPAPHAPVLASWPASRGPLPPLLEAMDQAGFVDPRVTWVGHEVEYESAAELWDAQTAIVTEVRSRIEGADAVSVERLRHRFVTEATKVSASGGTLVYPYGATLLHTRR